MNIDIRLKLDLFEHPKLQKLRRRLGAEGVLCLLRLWLWAAANRCDGRLRGLDADDVEMAAQWQGQAGALVSALVELRLLEQAAPAFGSACGGGEQGGPEVGKGGALFLIHDWSEHQPWASRSDERSARARKAARSRWGLGENSEERNVEYQQDSDASCSSMLDASPSNAPRAKNQEPETLLSPPSPSCRTAPARAKAASAGEPSQSPAGPVFAKAGGQGDGRGERFSALAEEGGQSPSCGDSVAHEVELLEGRAGEEQAHFASTLRDDSISEKGGFRPPTFAEVEMYCALRGNAVEPRRFWDWCEARQWRVGGERIRDWRALVRRFEQRERAALSAAPAGEGPPPAPDVSVPAARLPAPAAASLRTSRRVEPYPLGAALPLAGAVPRPAPLAQHDKAMSFASLRPSTVHQALTRERDLIARMILNENRSFHARQSGDSAAFGAAQPALPPEWADGR